MDLLKGIMTRRSIRKFTGEVISDEKLKQVLEAGFQAPSAHNREPREFVVVKDKEKLEEISDFHKYAKMLPSAGCGIVVCGDILKQKREGFLIEDSSASIQNMLLAAHGLGLGAVWCGLYPVEPFMEKISSILNLPENLIPVGMVVVGEKERDMDPVYRYKEEAVHFDSWSEKESI